MATPFRKFNVGKHRAGQDVDILITDSMVYNYYNDELLKTALRNNKEVRKKHASVLRNLS